MHVQTDDDIISDENPDVGPPTDNPSEDIVYNDANTEMSSFLPVGEQQQQEIEAARNQLLKMIQYHALQLKMSH